MNISLKQSVFIFILGIALVVSARFTADLFVKNVDKVSQSQVFARELDRKTNRALGVINDLQLEIRTKGARRTQLSNGPLFLELQENEGITRSEERRVGKERRWEWRGY